MNYDSKQSKATFEIPLKPISLRGKEELMKSREFIKLLMVREWPGTITALPDDPLEPRPNGYTGEWDPPKSNWVKRSFTITVGELPNKLYATIGALPGVVVNSLSYRPKDAIGGDWNVEGTIFTECEQANHDLCR
jgi:hypothetical protein